LAKQRDKEASAVAALSAAEQRRVAEEAALGARAGRLRAAEKLRAQLAGEGARVDAGGARAGDLVRAEHYREEAEQRLRSDQASEQRAEAQAAAARRTEDGTRDALSRARGAERAVDEHRARFLATESKESERREDEDAGDAWSASRLRAGKSPAR
jgi:hypothetical protein